MQIKRPLYNLTQYISKEESAELYENIRSDEHDADTYIGTFTQPELVKISDKYIDREVLALRPNSDVFRIYLSAQEEL